MTPHQAICHMSDAFRMSLNERQAVAPAGRRTPGFATIASWRLSGPPVAGPRPDQNGAEAEQGVGGTAAHRLRARSNGASRADGAILRCRNRTASADPPDLRRHDHGQVEALGVSSYGSSPEAVRRLMVRPPVVSVYPSLRRSARRSQRANVSPVLDGIRGVAVLGILLINIDALSGYAFTPASAHTILRDETRADAITWFLLATLVEAEVLFVVLVSVRRRIRCLRSARGGARCRSRQGSSRGG